jgi:hypothetical protein
VVDALVEARDCDIAFSPLTSLLPVRRCALNAPTKRADIVVAWIAVPALTLYAYPQRYEFVRDTDTGSVVRDVDRGRAVGFTADLDWTDRELSISIPSCRGASEDDRWDERTTEQVMNEALGVCAADVPPVVTSSGARLAGCVDGRRGASARTMVRSATGTRFWVCRSAWRNRDAMSQELYSGPKGRNDAAEWRCVWIGPSRSYACPSPMWIARKRSMQGGSGSRSIRTSPTTMATA